MASITRRGDLQWQARVRRKGYPVQIKTFNTRSEAEAWARQVESEIDRGVFVSRTEAESTTLCEALDRYEREIVSLKKEGPRSFPAEDVEGNAGRATIDGVGTQFGHSQIARRLAEADQPGIEAGVSASTLGHPLPRFQYRPQGMGMESLSNPLELVRKPPANNARTRRVRETEGDSRDDRRAPDGELKRVVSASSSDVLPTIISLAVETAMRRGEIVDLRWEHVDLKRHVAHLPHTKNGSSRDVPLSPRAVEALKEWRKVVGKNPGDGRVFSIRGDAVTRAFERAVDRARKTYEQECRDAGRTPDAKYLIDLRFHDLRHEATSRLASIFPMHELAKITGHRDPRMLMRYYHPSAEDLAKRLR